jgi:gamma-glutamyltranspeptidase/glutathione hydrolase
LVYSAKDKKVFAISGVGWSAKSFNIDWCKKNNVDIIPGDGYLPATVPAPVGTWALALARFGTMGFSEVLQPAIELAENGFPIHEQLQQTLNNYFKYFVQMELCQMSAIELLILMPLIR